MIAESMNDTACDRLAQRSPDPDSGRNGAERQIKTTGAFGELRDYQYRHDAEDRRGNTVEDLNGHQNGGDVGQWVQEPSHG